MKRTGIFAAALSIFLRSIAAGIMIAIGSAAYLNATNKIIGAFLFAIGLISILMLKYSLFTGAVGYAKTKISIVVLPIILIGNFVGSILCKAFGNNATAVALWDAKMDKPLLTVFWQSVLCGILVYVAVDAYKKYKCGGILVVIFAVAGFIIAGGEHSIADMCYMFAANALSWPSIKFILVVACGNIVGARLMGCSWGTDYLDELCKN